MRLIDANALREHMYHEAFETDSGLQKWDCGLWIRYRMFEDIIDTEITVEAELVRHGRWEEKIKDGKLGYGFLTERFMACSVCGEKAHYDENEGWLLPRYCPNCGAKMDEVERMLDKRQLLEWLKAMMYNGRLTKDMKSFLEVLYGLIETGTFDSNQQWREEVHTYTTGHNENETVVVE